MNHLILSYGVLMAALPFGLGTVAFGETDAPPAVPAAAPGAASPPAPRVIPPPPVPPGVVYQPDIVTGTGGGRALHVDAAWPQTLPAQPMPAILYVHGGGWTGGSHKIMRPISFATHGYFVATVEYRLSGEAQWPAQIEDCKLAVRWLRANAAKYHVDPNRIGVWGESAGGHLVACLGTMGAEEGLEGEGGYPGVSSKVQAVVDFFGPVDFLDPAAGETRDSALKKMFGGWATEKPDVWKQASPLYDVQAGDPPFLIIHGDSDKRILHVQSEKLLAALQKAGVPAELVTVSNAGHGFKPVPGAPPPQPTAQELNAKVLSFFDQYLKNSTTKASL